MNAVLAVVAALAAALLLGMSDRSRDRLIRLQGAARLVEPGRRRAARSGWSPSSSPETRWWWGLAPASAIAAGVLDGPAVATAVGLVVFATVRSWVGAQRRRVGRRRRGQVAEAVRIVVVELQAGARPVDALTAAADGCEVWSGPLRLAATRAGLGDEVAGVLLGEAELAPVGHCWRLAERTGAGLSSVLGRLADDLDEAERRHQAVDVALAGPRSSSALLAGLPILGLGLGAAMAGDPLTILLGTPAGHLLGLIGTALDVAGLSWIARLTRGVDP